MIISHKYNYIFIKNRKVAGTSVEIYLNKFRSSKDVFTPISAWHKNHVPQNYKGYTNILNELVKTNFRYKKRTIIEFLKGNKFWNHMPALLVKNRIDSEIWDSYFKFAIERNPWDKAVSQYFWLKKINKNQDLQFDTYLSNRFFPHDYRKYSDMDGKIIVDKIIKYEELNNELDIIFKKLKIPFEGQLNIFAKSSYRQNKAYREFYNKETMKIIEDVFKKEIEIFNYKF
jgi:hypothetical protein